MGSARELSSTFSTKSIFVENCFRMRLDIPILRDDISKLHSY